MRETSPLYQVHLSYLTSRFTFFLSYARELRDRGYTLHSLWCAALQALRHGSSTLGAILLARFLATHCYSKVEFCCVDFMQVPVRQRCGCFRCHLSDLRRRTPYVNLHTKAGWVASSAGCWMIFADYRVATSLCILLVFRRCPLS